MKDNERRILQMEHFADRLEEYLQAMQIPRKQRQALAVEFARAFEPVEWRDGNKKHFGPTDKCLNMKNLQTGQDEIERKRDLKTESAETMQTDNQKNQSKVPEKRQRQTGLQRKTQKGERKVEPYTEAELQNIKERQKEIREKGRLLADSAITTYFGRPSFHCYGNGNVNPAQGGLVYGDYLKTHNINPHTDDNKPENVQIYKRAMRGHQKVIEPPGPRKMCKSVKMYSKRERSP